MAELHSTPLSTFQKCPHPPPQPMIKWFFGFPFVTIPCVNSSLRNPTDQGLSGRQDVGIPGAPLQTQAHPYHGWACAGRGWCILRASTLAASPCPPFLPRLYFLGHQFTSRFLLGCGSRISITSHCGGLQSTSAQLLSASNNMSVDAGLFHVTCHQDGYLYWVPPGAMLPSLKVF